jgi:ActR/RegA family two-component response regulator
VIDSASQVSRRTRVLVADDDATLAASLERALAARSPALLGGTFRDGG